MIISIMLDSNVAYLFITIPLPFYQGLDKEKDDGIFLHIHGGAGVWTIVIMICGSGRFDDNNSGIIQK